MTTLTGKFVYEDNTPVANGILVLTLSQPCIISGTAQIVPLVKVIQLDASGNIPAAVTVYGNDALTPSGTTYTACLYTGVLDNATGLYNTGAQLFSLAWSITGASVDVSTLTPTANGASYVSPVTSIGLTMPGEFSVSGSPVTSAGTFVVSKVVQSANQVYAGPTSGGAAAPGFRALVDADIPVTLNNHQMTGTDSGTETLKNKTLNGPSNGNAVSLLNAQTQLASVAGNSADQLYYSFSLPGNTLAAGKVVRLIAYTFHATGTAAVTYGVSIGGTVIKPSAQSAAGGQLIRHEVIITAISGTSVSVAYSYTSSGSPAFQYAWNTAAPTLSGAVTIGLTFNVANTDTLRPDSFTAEIIQ